MTPRRPTVRLRTPPPRSSSRATCSRRCPEPRACPSGGEQTVLGPVGNAVDLGEAELSFSGANGLGSTTAFSVAGWVADEHSLDATRILDQEANGGARIVLEVGGEAPAGSRWSSTTGPKGPSLSSTAFARWDRPRFIICRGVRRFGRRGGPSPALRRRARGAVVAGPMPASTGALRGDAARVWRRRGPDRRTHAGRLSAVPAARSSSRKSWRSPSETDRAFRETIAFGTPSMGKRWTSFPTLRP